MSGSNQNLKLRATPEIEDFGKKYTEDGSGKLGKMFLDGYFAAVLYLLNQSGISKGKAIEIGCGEGFSTFRINKFLPQKIELSASEYVKKLIPKAQKLNPEVKITQESIYELKHKDKTFDIVFLLEVLEHLDYPKIALKEIKRVLKDDGVLVLGVPREPLWHILNMTRGKYIKDFGNTPGHLNHWSSTSLEKFIEKNFGPVIAKKRPLPWTLVLAKKHE